MIAFKTCVGTLKKLKPKKTLSIVNGILPFAFVIVFILTSFLRSDAAAPIWNEADKLASDEKYQEALNKTDVVLANAKRSGDGALWTEALIRTTRLQLALHGYEAAVRTLKSQAWPADAAGRALLNLQYVQILTRYLQAYRGEVEQREKVAGADTEKSDVETWTLAEFNSEIGHAFDDVMRESSLLEKAPPEIFNESLEKNNYPKGIRSTLRDVVVYMAVRYFMNAQYWTPRESSEIYRYDVSKLLQGASGPSGKRISANEPTRHPLEKVSSWLVEHREFHRRAKRPEAALEAQYELFEILQRTLTNQSDRTAILKALESTQSQPTSRAVSWWARGQALMAEFLRESTALGRLVEVHEEATKGLKAYPGSVGARMCEKIIHELERPDYSLMSMRSDAANRRSILVQYKNLKKLYFRAYSLNLEDDLKTRQMPGDFLKISDLHMAERQKSQKPVAEWSVDLSPTPDFVHHRKFVTPQGLKRSGAYAVLVSSRADFSGKDDVVQAVRFVVSDLVVATKIETPRTGRSTLEAQVLSGADGTVVSGASVSLYRYTWNSKATLVETKVADAHGVVQFTEPHKAASDYQHYMLVARKGTQVALELERIYFTRGGGVEDSTKGMIATDRAIYRSGQKLFWKISVYSDKAGAYEVGKSGTSVKVHLKDPNGQDAGTKLVKLGDFGSASGEFVIPAGRPLGAWSIETSAPVQAGTTITVEDYKRPTFEPTLKDALEPLRLNRLAKVSGEAKYYFGLPITQGEVVWRVTRQPLWEPWAAMLRLYPPNEGRDEVIASGASAVKSDGTFAFEFTPEVDERLAQSATPPSYRFLIEADVTDESGETRTASRSIRLGFTAIEAEISEPKSFYRAGEDIHLTANLRNLDGKPQAGQAKFQVLRLNPPSEVSLPSDLARDPAEETVLAKFATPDDRKRARWETDVNWRTLVSSWEDGPEVAKGELTHGAKGAAEIAVASLPPGVYRLVYQTTDSFGGSYKQSRILVVADKKNVLPLPLLFLAQASTVEVGQKAKFFLQSGFPKQNLLIEVYREGRRVSSRKWVSGRDASFFELPVTKDDRGGFGIVVSGIRDHQPLREEININVPWTDRTLKLSYSTFRESIRPGATERFRLTVKDAQGRALGAGAAEVLALMYDRSLDFFGVLKNPVPLDIYPSRIGVVPWNLSLAVQPGTYLVGSYPSIPPRENLREDTLKFHTSYGVGGPGRRSSGSRDGRMYKGRIAEEAMSLEAPVAAMAGAVADKAVGLVGRSAEGADKRPTPIRSNFSETAFFKPHLVTARDGVVSFEFTAPDSVTSWNLLTYAMTKDLRGGFLSRETKTVKEVMVRTYAPRFLREGDSAEIRVVVSNTTNAPIRGELLFDIREGETSDGTSAIDDFALNAADLKKVFSIGKESSATFRFQVKAPKRVGSFAFKATATAGDSSDGELQVFPVLPGRIHVAQSRFVALKNQSQKTIEFKDAAIADATRVNDKVVVTVDTQLFYGMLQAIPYLITSPYEGSEATLNRFLATGIVSSLVKKYPAVGAMARQLSTRATELEAFDTPDANRRMALEESPWLELSRGGRSDDKNLVRVLDPKVALVEREKSLARLRKMQLGNGAFPWYAGGPDDPFMTLYMLVGFGRALEYDIDIPKDVVSKAWTYSRKWVDRAIENKCCAEGLTLLSYAISLYPDASWSAGLFDDSLKKRLLDLSFARWKSHSPLLKGYLALALHRIGRSADAKLVWDSVMDSAKRDDQLGMYWAPEAKSWLWYNDTVETHAFALRVLNELDPKDSRAEGLVQWLFLNKKLNHWKSTRATAEALYAVAYYLEKTKTLEVKETIGVEIADRKERLVFDPSKYTGAKNQIVVEGAKIQTPVQIAIEKTSPGIAFASATWHFSTEVPPKESRGDFFDVSRRYFKRELSQGAGGGKDWVLRPLANGEKVRVGDLIEVQITIASKHEAEYVHLRDPRAAGLEPEKVSSGYRWDLGLVRFEEVRDSGANFFFSKLPVGTYTLKYRLRANTTGVFKVGPATIQSFYAPEFNAYSGADTISIH